MTGPESLKNLSEPIKVVAYKVVETRLSKDVRRRYYSVWADSNNFRTKFEEEEHIDYFPITKRTYVKNNRLIVAPNLNRCKETKGINGRISTFESLEDAQTYLQELGVSSERAIIKVEGMCSGTIDFLLMKKGTTCLLLDSITQINLVKAYHSLLFFN